MTALGPPGARSPSGRDTPRWATRTLISTLISALAVLGVGGLYGGGAMLVDPTGEGIGLSPQLLEPTPVGSYALPGLFILVVFGLLPILLAWAVWHRPALPALSGVERRTGQHWSWVASLAVGVVLLVWLAAQMALIGFVAGPQLATAALALLILAAAATPAMRRWLSAQPSA